MAYFEWHKEPGYYRDITQHFSPDAQLLDVGCGSAWLSRHFKNYAGIDASEEAVEIAAKQELQVQLASADETFAFPDQTFDGVILKDLLEHVNDPVSVVRETLRVLRPGGKVFASSPDAQRWVWNDYTHKRPFTRRAFRLLFADCGFEIERCSFESVMPGTSIISGWGKRKQRPRVLNALAWLPIVRRNVWVLAQRPSV